MSNLNILIVAPFTSLPSEASFNRFLYLANMWSKNYCVTLVTSEFNHATKKHRNYDKDYFNALPFKLVLIKEPGYDENVGISRLFSHHCLTKGIRDWLDSSLEKQEKYDIAYSAYPLISTNLLLAEYKEKFNYRLIIDVQDIWPESISAAIPLVQKLPWLLWPITKRAEKAYSSADGMVAVSNTYLDRAKKNNVEIPSVSIYIGADKKLIDSIKSAPKSDKIRLLYIGTISHSYDLLTVVRGVNQIHRDNQDIELHILGEGPHRKHIEAISEEGVIFHGLIPYNEMIAFAKSCDVLINPIVKTAVQSITNKLSDYILLGMPIINSQSNKEVMALIEKTNGFNYTPGSVNSFCDTLNHLLKIIDGIKINEKTKKQIVSLFDRNISYPKITEFILKVL